MPLLPRSSYYDENYRASAALLRARQPYLVKNILVGSSLLAVTAGIYLMTFKLVSQDDFSDLKAPEQATKET